IPAGIDTLDVALDYLGSGKDGGGGFLAASSPCMTPQLAIVNWHLVLLYPKGQPVREIQFKTDIKLPKGWKLGTALPIDSEKDERTQFKTVSLEMLADS